MPKAMKKNISVIIPTLTCLFYLIVFTNTVMAEAEISDPLESMNREIFWFNDKLDVHVLEPVAQAYHDNLPQEVRSSVFNFFDNLKYPVLLLSDVIQLKFEQAGNHTARFAINTTAGVAGIFDFASDWGFEKHEEDFGSALGYHGISDGPYIVLPFFGPSSARDVLGLVVDNLLYPTWHISELNIRTRTANSLSFGLATANVVNKRERLLDAVKSAKSASLDYYLFTRSAYKQSRDGVINDGIVQETEEFGE
jgi:phospholipid-binding lipoprotein MlaA